MKSLFIVAVLFVALGFFSCNPWGELNNPADIKSDKFQGFEVSATPDGIKSYSPANGVALADPPAEFVVSFVTGAEAYQLQISTTTGFEAPLILDKSDYTTNKMSPGSADMRTGGTLYWRARAKKAGVWGTWTTVWNLSLPRKYIVSYDGNGNTGGSTPVDGNRYLPGVNVTVLGNTGSLVNPGYAFVGWNTTADGSGTDRAVGSTFAMGSTNVVLYAKWSPTYTVTYDGNGNTGGSIPVDGNRYMAGASVTVAGNTGSLEKTGYSFVGWNTAANGSGTDRSAGSTFLMGSGNVTLYAKWVMLPTYTVTYNGNGNTGGSIPVDGNRYWTGLSVTVLGNTGSLVKAGYSFEGWNTASDGSGTDRSAGSTFLMGSGNVTLYAKWVMLPTYTVTYNGNGNTGGSIPVDGNRYWTGLSVTVLGNTGSLVKAGYSFEGWNTASDGSGTDRSAGSTFLMGSGNVTLYAKWVMLPTYTVTYNGNGNTGGSIPVDGNRYWTGLSVTVLGNTGSLVNPGYAFVGWNTTADGSGTDRAVGSTFAMGSTNVVLYAKWSPTYTVTYDGNGNTGGSIPVDGNRYMAGASVTVAGNTGSLEKTGYSFVGWNTAANGSGTDRAVGSTFAMGSGNVVLYANWVSESIPMVTVPGGSFQMGVEGIATPVHQVSLTGFRIGKYEVTQEQYLSVAGSSPSNFSGTNLPVEEVTWYDAVEFCNKLSVADGFTPVYTITGRSPSSGYPITSANVTQDMTKNGYRLPTEAEWEYTARGGNGSPNNYTYSGSNDINAVAWWGYYHSGNSGYMTHVVGTKAGNGLGLYDMSGNVWEWCQDWYGSYGSGAQSDPTGASPGMYRVNRGGGWDSNADFCQSAFRLHYSPDFRSISLGFRVVRRP